MFGIVVNKEFLESFGLISGFLCLGAMFVTLIAFLMGTIVFHHRASIVACVSIYISALCGILGAILYGTTASWVLAAVQSLAFILLLKVTGAIRPIERPRPVWLW